MLQYHSTGALKHLAPVITVLTHFCHHSKTQTHTNTTPSVSGNGVFCHTAPQVSQLMFLVKGHFSSSSGLWRKASP